MMLYHNVYCVYIIIANTATFIYVLTDTISSLKEDRYFSIANVKIFIGRLHEIHSFVRLFVVMTTGIYLLKDIKVIDFY